MMARNGSRIAVRLGVLLALGLAACLGGCATDFGDAGYRKPHAVARITRDQTEPLRHPGTYVPAYLEDAAETLSTRPNHYEAVTEQSQDGLNQVGHWWDALVGNPERRYQGDGARR